MESRAPPECRSWHSHPGSGDRLPQELPFRFEACPEQSLAKQSFREGERVATIDGFGRPPAAALARLGHCARRLCSYLEAWHRQDARDDLDLAKRSRYGFDRSYHTYYARPGRFLLPISGWAARTPIQGSQVPDDAPRSPSHSGADFVSRSP